MDGDHSDGAQSRLDPIGAIGNGANARVADVDELLRELLEQLVGAVAADTAAVLLVDDAGTHVLARATYGIEEEVWQGVRVPIGSGFAGRIAAERRPVVLDRVDETTVANPILWQKGIRRMLGVPLEGTAELLGVLHVGRIGGHSFTEHDTARLEVAAARIAAAIQARQFEIERAAGKVLQRSLLPSALPHCPGVEFATRFVPTEVGGVGGDWYDAFVLPSGNLWVVVGDVAGHGLAAAVSMGRLRAAMRAYALEGHSAETALTLSNRKFRFFDKGQMATVFLAVLPPPFSRATVALAGHPPPVIAEPDLPPYLLDAPINPPLGALDFETQSTEVVLPGRSVLLAYTDGLIERRGEPLDVGFDRLRRSMSCEDPERVCQRVMQDLVGDSRPADDIAVLALRRNP